MFVPKIPLHQERLDWSSLTHVRLKRGAVADTPACQRILDHIRSRCSEDGVVLLEHLVLDFPTVRKELPLGEAMRIDLRHMANLRESGTRAENKGLIELGTLISSESANDYPDELRMHSRFVEGGKKQVTVNAYERSRAAREMCIQAWGCVCIICGFDFEDVYGGRGAGFIHVHHIRPIAAVGEQYDLDPVADLRPVCPNCHAMIHRFEPALSAEEVKRLIDDLRQGAA